MLNIDNSGSERSNNYTNLITTFNGTAEFLEVAAITNCSENRNKVVRFQLKDKPNVTTIPITSELIEPLCYPLFFTHGEFGWGQKFKSIVKFPAYLASRLLMPENILCPSDSDNTILLNVNRYQLLAKLSQTYLVDMVSRAIDYRLQWNRNNQDHIFCGQPELRRNNENHVSEIVSDDDRSTFLPSSFHGSPRHLKELSNNALAIVSEYGGSDIFITVTTNPNWPEIQSQLLKGQTAFDRPDIVCQVI